MQVAGIEQLDPHEAQRRIDAGALLVDVREADERAQALVPGSLWVPMSQIGERVGDLPRDRPLVLQCAGGVRSQQVAQWLAPQGFDVANQMHGLSGWARMGLPVTAGEAP